MKLLVITNNALSQTESNGRITRTLLSGFKNEELCNFALRGMPDLDGVDYCFVSDGDALKSFITLGIKKPSLALPSKTEESSLNQSKKSQSPFNHCLRDVVWFSSFWKRGKVGAWLNDNHFDAVFLMAADASFLYRLAYDVSKKQGIPLFIYSSEDYYLKRYDYMSRKEKPGFWAKVFLRRLRKEAGKAFVHAKKSFLCSKKLLNSTKEAFGDISAEVMYQPSLLKPVNRKIHEGVKRIVYAGNINPYRLASLRDVAKVIHDYDPNLVLELYGRVSGEGVEEGLKEPYFSYKGMIPYEELLKVYEDTDLLIHVEGFDSYNVLDYAHAFSTKIGDCYQSGIPFFIYGPEEIPCVAFGKEVCPEFAGSELKEKLEAILSGKVTYNPPKDLLRDCFDAEVVGQSLRKEIVSGRG